MRTFLLAAAVAAVAGGLPAASAAPKPAPLCRQVADVPGDAKVHDQVEVASLDILSADVATGRRTLVAAVRLASLERHQLQAGGTTVRFRWTVGGLAQSVSYHLYATGETVGRFDADTTAGNVLTEVDVPFYADPNTATITWTVPRSAVVPLRKAGARFTGLTVETAVAVNHRAPVPGVSEGRGALEPTDTARSVRAYADGAATCLRVS